MSTTYAVTINGKISNVSEATCQRFGLRKQRGAKYFELVATDVSADDLNRLRALVEGGRDTDGEPLISGCWLTVTTEVANVSIPAALSDYHNRVERGLGRKLSLKALAAYTLDNVGRLQDAGALGAESVEMDIVLSALAGVDNAILTDAEVNAFVARWVAFMPTYQAAAAKFNAARKR